MSESVLFLKLIIVKADGSAVATAATKDDVALINNAMHSVFSDVQVIINGKNTEGVADGMYPYKSYIKNLF